MTNSKFNAYDVQQCLAEAIDRVGEKTHSREHVESLAEFAEIVLKNLTDTELLQALRKWKPLKNEDASALAASEAAKVFSRCNQPNAARIGPPTKFGAKLREMVERNRPPLVGPPTQLGANLRRVGEQRRPRPRKEALELAYWAYYATLETVGNGSKGQRSVSRGGPTLDQIYVWLTGERNEPPPLATQLVQHVKLRDTVFKHLNDVGFEVDKREADQFRQKPTVRQRKSGSGWGCDIAVLALPD